MQVSVESNGTLERTMKVEVPEEKIAAEVANRLKSLTKTTKIQGFRPGKVPLKLIQKRYGAGVRKEVVGETRAKFLQRRYHPGKIATRWYAKNRPP